MYLSTQVREVYFFLSRWGLTQRYITGQHAENKELRTVQSQIGTLCHTPSPGAQSSSQKMGQKDLRARVSGKRQFSKRDRADTHMSSWLLWQPAQDLWNLKPDEVPEWRGEGFRRTHHWLRSYWQLIVTWVDQLFSKSWPPPQNMWWPKLDNGLYKRRHR